MDNKFIEYKAKVRLGALGDMSTEWWTQKDWDNHAAYVERLKLEGNYLKEEEITIKLMPCPMFDGITSTSKSSNYSFKMIDLGNGKAEC